MTPVDIPLADAFELVADSFEESLRSYFLLPPGERNEGADFETVGHRWDDPAHIDAVTSADLLSLSLLNAGLEPRTIVALIDPGLQERVSELLASIPVNATIIDDADYLAPGKGAWELWAELSKVWGLQAGATTKSKLLARKRPLLVPIFDAVVRDLLGLESAKGYWQGMRSALRANDAELYRQAERWHADFGLPAHVTPLRVIDVVLWKAGKSGMRVPVG